MTRGQIRRGLLRLAHGMEAFLDEALLGEKRSSNLRSDDEALLLHCVYALRAAGEDHYPDAVVKLIPSVLTSRKRSPEAIAKFKATIVAKRLMAATKKEAAAKKKVERNTRAREQRKVTKELADAATRELTQELKSKRTRVDGQEIPQTINGGDKQKNN